MRRGAIDGDMVGLDEGAFDVGLQVGVRRGMIDGVVVGLGVGAFDGTLDGEMDGRRLVGFSVGL